MGMLFSGGMATMVNAKMEFLWDCPDHFTLEEAVTIPVVYGTVYYAMVMEGKCKPGESILIHAGSGGIGQAAIHMALHYGLKVYTTVGTQEKRDFIKATWPQIKGKGPIFPSWNPVFPPRSLFCLPEVLFLSGLVFSR